MGISIGQYRVRIGTYNCIRMKNYQTCLQDSFRRVMLMLFQLINIMVIMLMFVYICFLRMFCVSPEHPNFESFYCFSGTQIPTLVVTCMYYLSIFCVSPQHSKLANHCAYAGQIQQAIVPLLQTEWASHCATATHINQQAIVPLLQTVSASHCAIATRINQQAIVPLLQTVSASHCATATHINQQAIVPLLQTVSASHCAIATRINQQAIVPLLQTVSASHCATATCINQHAIVPLLPTELASHCATATHINQHAIVPLLHTKWASHCATKLNRQVIVPLLCKRSGQFCLKCFNQVIVLLTQISGYIVYAPLLLRMANDVEENPGPTIYDVVDPTKTICADFSQGNTKKFPQNAGKQCLAMSLTAIIYNYIANANRWDSTVLNSILHAGNNLYSFISNSVKKSYLLLTDVPEMVSVFDGIYCMQYGDPFAGDLFVGNTTLPFYSLKDSFDNLFKETCLNYQHCMLTIGCNTVAIFKTSEETFKVFDSHSRDLYGIPHPFGKCILASLDSIESLVIYFQSTVPPGHETPFEVKGVSVQLNSAITQITGLASSKGAKHHMKEKSSEEIESTKQSRLENARRYKKAKQEAETETEKQSRRKKAREYQKAKRALETDDEKQARLRSVKNYQKRKRGQETEDEKLTTHGNVKNLHQKRKRGQETDTEKPGNIITQQEYLSKFDIEKDGSIHEQSWAKFNINKFYKSIQFFVNQCKICREAWPLNSKPKSSGCYICSRCSRDTKSPKKFSVENSMIPSPVPTQLQNLTQVEEMLIARALPIMRVYIKPGGQRGYSGHCVNLPQNVKELAKSLPRYPKDLTVIIVKVKGRDNSYRDVTVRREKVHNALLWLVQNNPHYAELEINEDALKVLPENGIPADLMTVETENELISNDDVISDLGPPTDNPSEDIVYNELTETNSFLPVGEQQEQEIEAVRNKLSANEPMPWPATENEPLNEYQIPHLATMAFPTLFPDGKANPTNQSTLRNVPLQERIKHLLKFAELIDGKWVYRFANHPRFSYWAFNMIHRKRILQQSGIFLKQNPFT